MNHHPGASPEPGHARQGGFTWSEFTLVAVLVLGLFGAAIWAVTGIRSDTRLSECQTSLRTLKLATESYRAATDHWPASNEALVKDGYAKTDELDGYKVVMTLDGRGVVYEPQGHCR